MATDKKHFKFINSKTGNVIYHHSVNADLNEADIKAQLEKIKAEVASKNSVFLDTIYWEEDKEANI